MRRGAAAAAVVLALARAAAAAQGPGEAHVEAARSRAQVGEPVPFRVWVTVPKDAAARWEKPAAGPRYEFRSLAARRTAGPGRDTLWATGELVLWETGRQSVPGLELSLTGGAAPRTHRLPAIDLEVASVLPPGAPAELLPWRAPLPAPWWERVPWRWVAGGLLLAAGMVMLWRALRRRPAPVPVAAPAPDPAEAALAALAALRRLGLPRAGRLAEHAFELGQILRRYLEATARTPRPGDTSPELVEHLGAARFPRADLDRLAGLLAGWDQIKFARRRADADEAEAAERAVEDLVRRRSGHREAA